MPATGITAAKTNRSLVSQSPDRAASIAQRKRVMADPTLLFYRRFIDSALAEAKKTNRYGEPTNLALKTLVWIMEKPVDPDNKPLYFSSLAGVCEMLGLDVNKERKRMIAETKAAYAAAAVKRIQAYVNGRMGAVLTCAGLQALEGKQYVLGLVSVDEYEEIAGVEMPDPQPRKQRSKHKR